MKMIHTILSVGVAVIGIFMVARFAGKALPPLLSGIAFIIIGIVFLLRK